MGPAAHTIQTILQRWVDDGSGEPAPVPPNALLAEDGTPIRNENGDYILVEGDEEILMGDEDTLWGDTGTTFND